MARVLILTGDAAEELDSMYPVFRLREGGHEAVVAAPTTRAVKLVVHDFEPGCDAYTEKPGHLLPMDLAFAAVRPEDHDALVIPGGRAPEYLRLNPQVLAAVRHFAEADKPVAAICHGAQLLAAAGVRKGVACSAYPACGPEVMAAGGEWVDLPVDQAHTCGKLVTAPAWPAHPAWLAQFLKVLGSRVEP